MRRPGTSLFLFICGIALLASIFIGERMGAHALRRTTETAAVVPEETPTPQATQTQSGPIINWRNLQVVTVATDPGFPDPRVTKPPTPTPTPKPSPKPTPPPPSPPPAPLLGSTPTPSPSPSGSATTGIPPYAYPTPPVYQQPPNGGG